MHVSATSRCVVCELGEREPVLAHNGIFVGDSADLKVHCHLGIFDTRNCEAAVRAEALRQCGGECRRVRCKISRAAILDLDAAGRRRPP